MKVYVLVQGEFDRMIVGVYADELHADAEAERREIAGGTREALEVHPDGSRTPITVPRLWIDVEEHEVQE